nr:protein piccolo-like [Penaeus vannamei]
MASVKQMSIADRRGQYRGRSQSQPAPSRPPSVTAHARSNGHVTPTGTTKQKAGSEWGINGISGRRLYSAQVGAEGRRTGGDPWVRPPPPPPAPPPAPSKPSRPRPGCEAPSWPVRPG